MSVSRNIFISFYRELTRSLRLFKNTRMEKLFLIKLLSQKLRELCVISFAIWIYPLITLILFSHHCQLLETDFSWNKFCIIFLSGWILVEFSFRPTENFSTTQIVSIDLPIFQYLCVGKLSSVSSKHCNCYFSRRETPRKRSWKTHAAPCSEKMK